LQSKSITSITKVFSSEILSLSNMAGDPSAPKLDLKMLVVPGVLLFSRHVDFKNPSVVDKARIAFYTVFVLVFTFHLILYTAVNHKKKESKKIWIPPKPAPKLPFGLGTPPQPVKVYFLRMSIFNY
jgi:hypothetical protein